MHRTTTHAELDRLLDLLADEPETFEDEAAELAGRLDEQKRDLELRDPRTWRRHAAPVHRASFAEQFRADVENILPMDREEEARLARRIEFARLRLEKARREEGLRGDIDPGAVAKGGKSLASAKAKTAERKRAKNGKPAKAKNGGGRLPRRVQRRAEELHALRTEMVERNLYLVLINVERYTQTGASRMDLIQEGCVSLFRAVDGFDWRRGLLFRTYAVHWLNQAFRNYLYNNSHTVRVPVYLQKALKHINQATIRLGKENASPEEIAASSDLNENLVQAAMTAARGSFSIDVEHSSGDDGSRLRDMLVDDAQEGPYDPRIEDVTLEDGLGRALGSLSEREALVLRMRFGVGHEREHTLAEVADRLGVSVERVRQIQVRALGKLDTPTLRRELDPYLN